MSLVTNASARAPLSQPRAHFYLHVTVLLWGLTAPLGKAISIGAKALVFYRVSVVAALALAVVLAGGQSVRLSRRDAARYAAIGALVVVHWVAFYACIKHSGVALAVLCLSTVPFFTALLEPLFFDRKIDAAEAALGSLAFIAACVVGWREAHATLTGLAIGMLSAVCAAAFGTWNGIVARRDSAARMTFFIMFTSACWLGVSFAYTGGLPTPNALSLRDIGLLGVLAVFCTLIPWLLTARSLAVVTPFTVAIAVTLEPVYSLIFAYLAYPLSERLGLRFYLGAAVPVVLVMLNGLRGAYKRSQESAKSLAATRDEVLSADAL
jgi:drug/metabolite transporter (DMT)-like permease